MQVRRSTGREAWWSSSCCSSSHICPRSLDCARAGRHFCLPGSSRCGPCLNALVEDSHGHCVVRRRHAHHHPPAQSVKGKGTAYPVLDEEIDFLSAVISEQRVESAVPDRPLQNVKSTQLGKSGQEFPTERPAGQSFPFSSSTPPATAKPSPALLSQPLILPHHSTDHLLVAMSAAFIAATLLVLVIAGACWVRLQKGARPPLKMDHPAHRMMRAHTLCDNPGDQKLAHSAHMYHYQHQKQQMLSLEKHRDEPKLADSAASTDEENEDGDFTVYECPGLAPTGEMEVKNPLFDDTTLYLLRFHK
ncbi:unnamed protein product [Menidia menidia]|uniref:(Atlantic silverside) hypothetical protein n=1 Tax=Menidia menidia TaxID=238744 RepID=A0A8S4AX43_9TELE|nr:unnamed protein product [Menidia menidia]